MPFIIHEYPKWAERTVRFMRIGSYAFFAITGLTIVFFTPALLTPELYVITGSMAIFGLVCLVATTFKLYVMEWVSLFFLSAGVLTYVAGIWAMALSNIKYVASASIFMVLVLLMLIRLVDLTVFWMRNVRATKLHKELPTDDC